MWKGRFHPRYIKYLIVSSLESIVGASYFEYYHGRLLHNLSCCAEGSVSIGNQIRWGTAYFPGFSLLSQYIGVEP